MPFVCHALDHDLQTLDGRIHESSRSAAARFFAQDVPRLDRLSQFKFDAALIDRPNSRKSKLEVRGKPIRFERDTELARLRNHLVEIAPNKMRQQESVVQRRAPMHELVVIRLLPKPRDQCAQQKLLSQAHPRVRRHFETAKLDQAQSTRAAVG